MTETNLTPEYKNPKYIFNRELSWLQFNQRVLQEGVRKSNPLLERLKFLAITANNLDEFFEVRVAGYEQKRDSKIVSVREDGYTPTEVLDRIYKIVSHLIHDLYGAWNNEIIPELEAEGYQILPYRDLNPEQREYAEKHFLENLMPVLTPIKVDPAHPFPWVINKALCVATLLDYNEDEAYKIGVVTVPRIIPRIIRFPEIKGQPKTFSFLSEVVKGNIHHLFKGYAIHGPASFRITRNSNLYLNEEEVSDLLEAIEAELHNRMKGEAVRMEISHDAPGALVNILREHFHLHDRQIHKVKGPVNFNRVMAFYKWIDRPDLKQEPFAPADPEWMITGENIFNKIREKDIMLYHPYDSYTPVLHFLTTAARDPNVQAIKITLYRTTDDSPIIKALIEAAQNGKEVTVVMELKARFDEESNATWARFLQDNGVHVVYGLLGLKTHCKTILIIRWEEDRLVKYAHVGTGNYNESTARLYTDLSMFTWRSEITRDLVEVFTMLTSQSREARFNHILVSPEGILPNFVKFVENEIEAARQGKAARIIFKVNSLLDIEIVEALYRAAEAGVKIYGIVRGICALRPRSEKYSKNIKIVSIVSRFLEHARIYYFENSPAHKFYIGSADLMPRNLRRRVEILAPVMDADHQKMLMNILEEQLNDTHDGRVLRKHWIPPEERNGHPDNFFSSQQARMRMAQGLEVQYPEDYQEIW